MSTWARHVGAVFREAAVSAITAPVASLLIVVMIAGMCAAVLLTSGRTVGAEQAVIGSIDSAGTRSIVVRADAAAGLRADVLDRLSRVEGIEWAGAFGPADDAQNAAFVGGTRVPLRRAWSDDWRPLGIAPGPEGDDRVAFGSRAALDALGLREPAGAIRIVRSQEGFAVGGRIRTPDHLAFLEPVLLAPATPVAPATRAAPAAAADVSVLVVIAERPDLVAPVAETVQSVLAVADPTKVSVQTSEQLATLRALIEGQLGGFGRSLTLAILGLTAVLAAAILYGVVMLRRKDFGRRRALGAGQRLIIALLMTQVGLLAVLGAIAGSAVALIVLAATGDPSPGLGYVAGVAVLAVAIGLIAGALPALAAARREPIVELRVP